MVVRIQAAQIKNFHNIAFGEIRFPCNISSDIFAPKADVLGIYGQNSSGKTTFLHALDILKSLLTGKSIREHLSKHIALLNKSAEISFHFSILMDTGEKIRAVYSVILEKSNIIETLKTTYFRDKKWSYLKAAISCDLSDTQTLFLPKSREKEYWGFNQEYYAELRVNKLLCAKELRSFIFSEEFLELLDRVKIDSPDASVIRTLHKFGVDNLFVILQRPSDLMFLNTPPNTHLSPEHTITKPFALPLDKPFLLSESMYPVIRQAIDTVNTVLMELIPQTRIALRSLGNELLENVQVGILVQVMREHQTVNGEICYLPFQYESAGVKKIVSVLHLIISAYNNPSMTLAIDDLDSGVYEYLLGELLHIMQATGQGQLIFTSHSLRPLETLATNSAVFTTMNAENRYIRLSNIKITNNLRLRYLREIALGSDSSTSLSAEINSSEIAHAMRKAK